MPNFDKMTTEEFETLLYEVVGNKSVDELMAVPGVYEALQEEFNNEVLELWEESNSEPDEEEEADEVWQDCTLGTQGFCSGELWQCQTCKAEFCDEHWHETEQGHNVECSACERMREIESGEEE